MAKKRKKRKGGSKSSKKKRKPSKSAAPDAAATLDADAPREERDGAPAGTSQVAEETLDAEDPDVESIDTEHEEIELTDRELLEVHVLDSEADEGETLDVVEVISAVGTDVVEATEAVSLDDDSMEDPEVLLAQLMDLEAESESGDEPTTVVLESDVFTDEHESDLQQKRQPDDTTVSFPERQPEAPRMTTAAYEALRELSAEGAASLADEVVLDLGEETTADERDRLLAAALAQAEMQDATYRTGRARGRAGALKWATSAGLLSVAGMAFLAPPSFLTPQARPSLTPSELDRGARIALALHASEVEAFRVLNNRLPDSLNEVTRPLGDVRYVRSSTRHYQLVTRTRRGGSLIYESAIEDELFARASSGLTALGDGN